ncbi:hypothetical protein PRIPAC_95640 [Pristionchus pacificus]|uniref:Uncharacterized protein n=1 Tax=Pristionchus pacificus TaxID=54126 RepID=A0A454XRW9_PRIPA|nr:hypothetical protein PRIPAC_95640 [Pristionchus pacificus]|eukprot:PDM63523.1 hypothetical protein PRIPAC_53880 [Pristionchus pacificus]
MRLLLVAALVAAAFAARDSLKWDHEVRSESVDGVDSFKAGFEYRFNLESQVSNGLPVPGSQQSAVRSKSLVTLSFPESETVAHLRLEKIRVASLQKEIDEPKKIQPFELFEEIELNEEHLRTLRLPVRFRYENGMVSDIEFDREDLPWSMNIKRVYINMLQVNLSQKNTHESRFNTEFESKKENVFSAPEVTLEGDCEVVYTVLPESSSRRERREESELLVTKSINFEKCSRRVGQRYNFRFGDECPSCENKFNGEERNIESSTVFNYRIAGTPSRFVIKEVELRSVYSYAPLSEQETFFTTFVSGNMRLIEVNKEQKRIAAPKSEKKETLLYSMEWEKKEEKYLATGDESLLKESPFPEIKNKHEVVARLIKSVIVKMETEEKGIELAATQEMARIVKVLRFATKEEINRIHKECSSESQEESVRSQMKEIFHDALALAGSFNAVEHLVEKIRAREFSPLKSATLLKQLTSIRVPSEKIVKSLVSLCKDSRRQPLERQSCWLTAGALMHGVCGDHRDKLAIESSEERKCPRDIKEDFVRELVEEFERAETRYEKVLALKTIANSGMDLIVFPLEKIIRDEKEEITVRVQAIESLRKLRSVLPRKMVNILMPLYKNIREHPEIRVAAFNQIMHTVPEKSVIDQITFQLDNEPSTQVYSFVYSTLEQYSRSEIPCEKSMVDSITSALRSIRSQPRKLLSSTFKHWTIYNEENKNGATLNWAALFSNNSVLPTEVMTSLETAFAGQWNKYLAQIGIHQHNIDQVLYKILEKVEKSGLEEVLVRGKRSSFKPTEILRGLFSKLAIVSRKQSEHDPHALVYIRFRDMDYALLPIDEEVIPEMIKTVLRNGRIELGEIESFLAKGFRFNTVLSSFVYERTRSIATSMGSPLIFSSKMPTIFKIDGSIKVELEPRNGDSLDGLRVRVQARPALASTHITKVEINFPMVSLGVKLLHSASVNVPVDMTTEMSWNKKFDHKTTLALPKESRRVIQLQTRPITFVRVWPKETRVYVEPKEKTIYVEELETLVHKIRSSHLEKATGLRMNVEGHVHGHIWEKGTEGIPSALLIGENNLEISFEKTAETPKEYVIKTEVSTFDEESRMEKPSMEKFFEKDNEEHFKTEEYEEYDGDEKERRSSFNNYVKSYKSDKAYSHRLWAEIKAVGGRMERKVEIDLRSVCDEKLRHCKINFDGLTTPLLEKETRDWKIESSIEMLYPEMPETLEELLKQKHRELSINVESRWGSDYKNELKMKIQGEQNKEQKRWMKRVAELRERKEDSLTALEEYTRLVEASMLNQYKVLAKYDIACPMTRSLFERFYVYSKVSAPWFSSTYEFGHNEERIVRALLTIEPSTRQYANLTLETPSEKVSIRDFRLPVPLRLVNIRRQSMTPIRSLSTLGSNLVEETKAMCTVESRKVNSFDDVIFRTPLTTCYSVLAKDCSSEEPEFAVLLKKISKDGEEKKMKIVCRKSVIELEMDKRSEKMRVTINGEKVERVEKLEEARVYKKNEVVVVELDDVTVEFDGYTANVKLSEYYKNKQCGICGHFDGEKKTEFRRADNEETEDIEEFHRSFLVKGEECEVEEEKLSEKRNYRLESEESSSEEESIFETKRNNKNKWESKKNVREEKYEKETEVVEPIEKTRVIEYSNRVCFSKSPVPECPSKSMENEDKMKEMKVKFTCLPRSDRETARLMRETRRDVLSLEDFPESFVETINTPKSCLAY